MRDETKGEVTIYVSSPTLFPMKLTHF